MPESKTESYGAYPQCGVNVAEIRREGTSCHFDGYRADPASCQEVMGTGTWTPTVTGKGPVGEVDLTMDRVAVFVDAGYLFAEGARALSGRRLARSDVRLDHRAAVAHLVRFARGKSGMPLLRIYWYDATANRPTRSQVVLAEEADVKLRLGRVDADGRQKGVDALIASDLVSLARNRAMADCVLLSGDDDLRIAVSEIQGFGVRVHLVGICPAPRTQSRLLRQEADSTSEWGAEILRGFMHCRLRSNRRIDVSGMGKDGDFSAQGTRPHHLRPEHAPAVRDMARKVARQVLARQFASRTGRYP